MASASNRYGADVPVIGKRGQSKSRWQNLHTYAKSEDMWRFRRRSMDRFIGEDGNRNLIYSIFAVGTAETFNKRRESIVRANIKRKGWAGCSS